MSVGRWRRAFLRLAWALAAAALCVLLVRTFVLGVYRVDSASMEPFLHGTNEGGELVAVLYRRRPALARYDPVVILRPGERDPVVKRVTGLPDESVQLAGGDLFIDGERVGADVPRPELIPLYDERVRPLDEAFQLAKQSWSREPDAWRLDGRGTGAMVAAVGAIWTHKLTDQRVDASGRLIEGEHEIGDVALDLELQPLQATGRIALRLTEEGDRFDLEIDLDETGPAQARIVRHAGSAPQVVLAEGRLELAPRTWHRLRFANVDNAVSLDVDGATRVLLGTYERNTPLAGVPDEGYHHVRPRVSFGVAGLEARVRAVQLLHDVVYTSRGTHGVALPLRLGPDEIFVLGDNSPESLDSRDYGPVPLDRVIGLPLAVVWPPSAWRRLAGPAASAARARP